MTSPARERVEGRDLEEVLPAGGLERVLSGDWDGLRHDPRFLQAEKEARQRFETMLQVVEDARLRGEVPPHLEQPLADLLEGLGFPAADREAA